MVIVRIYHLKKHTLQILETNNKFFEIFSRLTFLVRHT